MAQTNDGKKFNRIPEHTRGGKSVKAHVRSNPKTSDGVKRGK